MNDALLIYDALKAIDARITTRCYGYTASAATIIAQAADVGCREISSNAMYLIHKSTCSIDGNAEKLASRAELLHKTDERLAQIYALHGGAEAEAFTTLMAENNGDGRWLTAEEAVEAGLADKIIDNLFVVGEVAESEQEDSFEADEVATTEELLPMAKACDCDVSTKQETRMVIGRVAHAIIRYLLGRVAYRWDEWMDKLEQKQKERAKQTKEVSTGASSSEVSTSSASSTEISTEISTGSATGDSTASEGGSLPQDSMPVAKGSRSVIGLSEGQRRVSATEIKPTEDPSMTRVHSLSNEKAYDEDAKMFSR